MKKLTKLFISLTVFASLFLAGCKDPVFYYIDNDVPSETATVFGVIRSIARYTTDNNDEYLVTVGSGGFMYKRVYDADAETKWVTDTQKHGTWTYVRADQLPFKLHSYNYTDSTHSGQQIIKIVSNSDYIYLITVDYYDTYEGLSTPKNVYIWAVKPEASTENDGYWKTLTADDWTELVSAYNTAKGEDSNVFKNAFYVKDSYTYSDFNAFSTNTPKKANRSAYIHVANETGDTNEKYKYFKLSGKTLTDYTTAITLTDTNDDGKDVPADGVAYFNGIHFFKTSAVVTDETIDSAAKTIYWGSDKYLKHATNLADIPEDSVDVKYKIKALAVCSDAVLIGLGQENNYSSSSSGGIQKVQIDSDGNLEATTGTFTTNAQTQLLSSYILSLVFNTNPADAELNSSLYAGLYFIGSNSTSSVSFDNEGLWSYYPARGNWNRE